MAETKFDSKSFNPQAFGAYVNRIPNTTKTELAKSGAVGANEQARGALSNQTGALYARVPYFGRISGKTSQNNDGAYTVDTDYKQSELKTFIKSGVFAMHNVSGETRVLSNINSLVSDTEGKSKEIFGDNQCVRIMDQIANDIAVQDTP